MDDAWVERWLSAERFATYTAAAGGDRARALRLYEWNVLVSGALFHDLAHLEIGLRNAYDRALARAGAWTSPACGLFTVPAGQPDRYARLRQQIEAARVSAAAAVRGEPAHGDVVAQLSFGFWRFLGAKAYEKTLWVPYLHRAFPRGTNRRADVDEPLARLHRLRNRIAHHEPLLRVNVRARVADVVALASRIDPELGCYVATNSSAAALVAARP